MNLKIHTRQTMQLAWPLVITQVGHIITGIVDNLFLGGIGPTEQAAGIFSNNLYTLLLVFTIGVSYASTPLVTSARENADLFRSASLFKNSLFLNFAVAMVCFLTLFFSSGFLHLLHQPAEVIELAIPFFSNNHLKLEVFQKANPMIRFQAIAYDKGDFITFFQKKIPMDIVFKIQENSFKGSGNLQLVIEDLRVSQ